MADTWPRRAAPRFPAAAGPVEMPVQLGVPSSVPARQHSARLPPRVPALNDLPTEWGNAQHVDVDMYATANADEGSGGAFAHHVPYLPQPHSAQGRALVGRSSSQWDLHSDGENNNNNNVDNSNMFGDVSVETLLGHAGNVAAPITATAAAAVASAAAAAAVADGSADTSGGAGSFIAGFPPDASSLLQGISPGQLAQIQTFLQRCGAVKQQLAAALHRRTQG